jgi:ankyrin repeat protein
MILTACRKGEITKLRLWASLGIHGLFSAGAFLGAAANRRLNVVRFLVEEVGVSVDQADGTGTSPLIVAATLGHLDLVRRLANLGADISQKNNAGAAPFYIAAQQTPTCIAVLREGARCRR